MCSPAYSGSLWHEVHGVSTLVPVRSVWRMWAFVVGKQACRLAHRAIRRHTISKRTSPHGIAVDSGGSPASLGVFDHLHAFLGASRVSMHLLVSNGAFDSETQRMGERADSLV